MQINTKNKEIEKYCQKNVNCYFIFINLTLSLFRKKLM